MTHLGNVYMRYVLLFLLLKTTKQKMVKDKNSARALTEHYCNEKKIK